MADDSKINSELDNNPTIKENNSKENADDNIPTKDKIEGTTNRESEVKPLELPQQNESSFEDGIDLDKEINFDDIDALQKKIKQSMGFTDDEPEEDDKQDELNEKTDESEETGEFKELNEPKEPDKSEEEIDDSVLKKYAVYISKDFVPLIDNLTMNELSAYINDAIQKKLDLEEEQRQKNNKKRIITHIIIAILTAIIMLPILLLLAHKSMMATFENYKYSQDNFENLYKQKFQKDRVYLKSLEYNKLHSDSLNENSKKN